MARVGNGRTRCDGARKRQRSCLSESFVGPSSALSVVEFMTVTGVLLLSVLCSRSCWSSGFVVVRPVLFDATAEVRRATPSASTYLSAKGLARRHTLPGEDTRGTWRTQRHPPRRNCLQLSAAPANEGGTGTAIEDINIDGFQDLSGGRNTCLKRVDEPGDPDEGNPTKGSKVTVHYSMRILGGNKLGSSKEQEGSKPFQFILGQWPSQAMHGWDKAISSMHLGEIATLLCGPQYAFGAEGAPPRIPPNATIETELELVDWMDLAATYNAKPGQTESDDERMARWRQELEDGTSPMRPESGLDKRVQEEIAQKSKASADGTTDPTGRKIYDVNSEEARKILAKQKVQGYTHNFGYIERANYYDLYIPVPKGTTAKQVTCEIHPDSMILIVEGSGVIVEGEFQGKVILDGCYWLMTDLSLDPPPSVEGRPSSDLVREGPVSRGETCVQVFLEKRKPYDTLWNDLFKDDAGDGVQKESDGTQQGAGTPRKDGVTVDATMSEEG